ncbi:MAG: glycolate oxidase subunit GlcF [Halioglobus sp.]|nr:glycolate oxidase subunit GlcF [Halioglobus sp.]
MHVKLHPTFADTRSGQAAKAITSACVHCGLCLPTCPTYLDSRDERDSPRGRIYLIKNLLETGEASSQTQLHLDRCLTCRSCETHCPSGMQYGELIDIGRDLMEQAAPRPAAPRVLRWLLRFILSRPRLLQLGLAVAQFLRPLLPAGLRRKVPLRQIQKALPAHQHARKMLIFQGCVQSAATPNTNDAVYRVLDRLGISLIQAPKAGCCGAVNYHLAAHADGLDNMRRNIDAWWPYIQHHGAEAIISSASGCGAMLVDYGRLLADDADYAKKAQRVSQLSRDIGEILIDEDISSLPISAQVGKVAIHSPCTLQHALQQPDLIATLLQRAGFDIAITTEKLLCCGSAGTYSILQSTISEKLRDKTLQTLEHDEPAVIATANIGCQLHLQAAAGIPVVHWIELLDTESTCS